MKRTGTGAYVLDFKVNTQACDRPVRTTWQTPENVKPKYMKLRLCELGPDCCPSCGLCAFGRIVWAKKKPLYGPEKGQRKERRRWIERKPYGRGDLNVR